MSHQLSYVIGLRHYNMIFGFPREGVTCHTIYNIDCATISRIVAKATALPERNLFRMRRDLSEARRVMTERKRSERTFQKKESSSWSTVGATLLGSTKERNEATALRLQFTGRAKASDFLTGKRR